MTIDRPDDVGQEASLFRAVLWDIDGTLLLSESMHFRALRHALATEGIEAPDEFHHEIVGRAAKVVFEKCRQTFGLSMSFDDWRRLKYSFYTAHAATRPMRRRSRCGLARWKSGGCSSVRGSGRRSCRTPTESW
jgi:hypothetical protein